MAKKRNGDGNIEVPAEQPEISSGNVFADVGLPNPILHAAKAQLVQGIARLLEARKLSQKDAAALLEVSQPDVSRMLRGEFSRFTIDRLTRFLLRLDLDVEIKVANKRDNTARVSTSFAKTRSLAKIPRDGDGHLAWERNGNKTVRKRATPKKKVA